VERTQDTHEGYGMEITDLYSEIVEKLEKKANQKSPAMTGFFTKWLGLSLTASEHQCLASCSSLIEAFSSS
jgi:hypothetical protein